MQKTLKKSISILLSILIIVGVFTIVPITASAETMPWTDEITTGGEYTCPSTLSHNTIVSGGTEENPVIINITGQTTVQAPIFLRSGYLKIVGNNNSVVANHGFVSFSVNVSSSCRPNGNAHLTVTDFSFLSTNATNQYIQILSQNYKCQSSLENVTFKNCNVNGSGAVVIGSETTHTLKNCTFEDNTGYNAGGITVRYGSDVTMEGCTFKNCTRTRPYSTSFLGGGAVWVRDNAKLTLDGCTFENCTGECGAVGIESTATLTLKGDTTITGNSSGNLYLPTGATVKIDEDFTGTVGVTTETAPTDSASVLLASNLADTQAALANKNIVSDNENYGVIYKDNSLLLINSKVYTVTWKNDDGTVLKTEALAEGTTPTYNGADPEKAEDEKYTYAFAGWSPEITAVTGDVTYTAQYTATFKGITSDELYKGLVIDAGTPIKFMMRINKQIYLGIDLHVYLDDTLVKDLQSTVGEATEPDRYYTTTKKCIVDTYSGQPGMPSIHTLYLKSLYTVTWKDEDGTVLKAEDVAKGDTPSYGATPTKAEDENYTYTFAGWAPEITAVTGDATYKATYTATAKPTPAKLILNVGENGKVVMDNGTFGNATDASNITEKSAPINVADGAKVFIVDGRSANLVEGGSINIATGGEVSFYPSADNTGKITAIPDEGYALYGWYDGDTLYSEDTVLAYQNIDKTTTLTAVFAPAHTVTWKDAGGTILRTDTIAEGKTPSYGSTPTKANDDYHSYNFSGWTDGTNTYGASDTLPAVTGDVTYTAKYTVFTKQFTVFVKTTTGKTITANGVSGDTTVAELKNMVVEESGIPAAEQRLIFAGKEMENEKTLADYRIQKESTLHVVGKSYTITWKNDDGTVIDTTSVAYGTVPTHTAPTKAEDESNTYTFSGWTPEITAVTGDATYKATYTATAKPKDLFTGHSINLGGDIGVNFFINSRYPALANANSAKVRFTWDDEYTAEVDLKALTPDATTGYYKATVDVVAAHMNHPILAEVFVNGTKLTGENEKDEFKVQTYAKELYDNPEKYVEAAKKTQLKNLAKALLNYGSEAQEVFKATLNQQHDRADTNVGTTDYSGVTSGVVRDAINGEYTENLRKFATEELGNQYFTNSLIYLSKNTLRIYFIPPEGESTMPNSGAYDGHKLDYYYYVQKTNIAAAELDNVQTFNIAGKSFSYSPLNYVADVLETTGEDTPQNNLAKSVYLYNQAANAFFDN